MSDSYGKAVQEELAPLGRNLRKAIPDVYKGFGELHEIPGHGAWGDVLCV